MNKHKTLGTGGFQKITPKSIKEIAYADLILILKDTFSKNKQQTY